MKATVKSNNRKKVTQNKTKKNQGELLEEAVFSVSEFLDYINALVGTRRIFVRGEVTGAKPHQTGFYFSLKDKDDGSIMECYMNPFAYRGLGFLVDDGMEIKISGFPNIYKARGRFSFKVESIELTGEGSLKKAYELLKQKLQDEGLFSRKRSIPEFISSVGIITSKTGAVIDDFRKNLLPLGIKLHFYDSRVEGIRAVSTILNGIKWFNINMPDLDTLVIVRGGGSLEDLQAFNNELVARAVFSSSIPTICGIGHDKDIPIVSLVGDVMTSTPSIAAVVINNSWNRLTKHIPLFEISLWNSYSIMTETLIKRVSGGSEIILRSFEQILNKYSARTEFLFSKISSAFKQIFVSLQHTEQNIIKGARMLERRIMEIQKEIMRISKILYEKTSRSLENTKNIITKAEALISAMSPERNLRLGYSIVKNSNGAIVRNAQDLKRGEIVVTRVNFGEFTSEVRDVIMKENYD